MILPTLLSHTGTGPLPTLPELALQQDPRCHQTGALGHLLPISPGLSSPPTTLQAGAARGKREQQVQVSGCAFQIHTHTLSRTHTWLCDCLLAVDKEQREGEKMQKSSEGFLGRGRVYKSPHKVLLYSKTSESTGMSQPLWHLEYWS